MVWPVTALWESNPFEEMQQLHREIDRLFRGHARDADAYPPVSIHGNDEELILTAEVPGIDPADIDIQVQGDHVTIKGERKPAEMADDVACYRRERGHGQFVRSFRLPYDVQADKVEASAKSGILTVKLPRAEFAKPRQISVNAG